MTKILAFSGKKQSGKNTLCNFMHGYFLKANNIINAFDLTTDGDLVVETLVRFEDGDKMELVPMDVTRIDIEFAIWAMDSVWPYIKHYAFATALKEVLIGLFEAPRDNMYGTDEQKNELSNFKWEDMPIKVKNKSGQMTYRELMQYFGTNVCRKIYPDIWTGRTIKDITNEQSEIAVISDARFENEIKAVQDAGGKVIRLTRNVLSGDEHQSETELDTFDGYDAVIDNQNMTIEESCQELFRILDSWGWIPKEIVMKSPEVVKQPAVKKERFTSIK